MERDEMLARFAAIDETRQIFREISRHAIFKFQFVRVCAGNEAPVHHLFDKHPFGIGANAFDILFAKETV
jgi:hypothetical protein